MPVYTANFEASENYPENTSINGINGWTVTGNPSLAKSVLSPVPCSGVRCLELTANSTAQKATLSVNHGQPPAGAMFIDFYIRPVATVAASPAASAETIDIDGGLVAFHRSSATATTGQFYVLNGDGLGGGQWLATGLTANVDAITGATTSWVNLTVHHDYTQGTWNLWVNDQAAVLNCGCHTVSPPGTTTYVAWNSTTHSIHVDDIYLTMTDDSRIGSPNALKLGIYTEGVPGNGLTAGDEARYGTSPYTTDTDGDGVSDLVEIQRGTNPRDGTDTAYISQSDPMQDITLKLGPQKGAGSHRWTARVYELSRGGTVESLRYTFTHPLGLIATNDGLSGNPVPLRCRAACSYITRITRSAPGTATPYTFELTTQAATGSVSSAPVVRDLSGILRTQSGDSAPPQLGSVDGSTYVEVIGAPPYELRYGPGFASRSGDQGGISMLQGLDGTAQFQVFKNRSDLTATVQPGPYTVVNTVVSAGGQITTYTIARPWWSPSDRFGTLTGGSSRWASPASGPSWLRETLQRGSAPLGVPGAASRGQTRMSGGWDGYGEFLRLTSTFGSGGPGPMYLGDMAARLSSGEENDGTGSGGTCSGESTDFSPYSIGATGNEGTAFDDGVVLQDGGGGGCCGGAGGGGGGGGGGGATPYRGNQGQHSTSTSSDADSRPTDIWLPTSGPAGRGNPTADASRVRINPVGGAAVSLLSNGRPAAVSLQGSPSNNAPRSTTGGVAFTYAANGSFSTTHSRVGTGGVVADKAKYTYSNPSSTVLTVNRARPVSAGSSTSWIPAALDSYATSGLTFSGLQETVVRTHEQLAYANDGVTVTGGLKSELTYVQVASDAALRTVRTKTWRRDAAALWTLILDRETEFRRYAWGERMIRESEIPVPTIDGVTPPLPAPPSRSIYYTWVDTGAVAARGLLRSMVTAPEGRWVYHQYDAEGRPVLTVQQYAAAPPPAAASLDASGFPNITVQGQNVVFAVEQLSPTSHYEVVRVQGLEVERKKYTALVAPASGVAVETKLSPSAGALSVTTIVNTLDIGAWFSAGKISSVIHPDGTRTVYDWSADSVVERQGLFTGGLLTEGQTTTTFFQPDGRGWLSREVIEKRASGGVFTASRVDYSTTVDADSAQLTRIATWSGLGKSCETWNGPQMLGSISRSGAVTDYDYDAQGRQWRTRTTADGRCLAHYSVYNALGQKAESWRVPLLPGSPETALAAPQMTARHFYDGLGDTVQTDTLLPDGTFLPSFVQRDQTTPGRTITTTWSTPTVPGTGLSPTHGPLSVIHTAADGALLQSWSRQATGEAPRLTRQSSYSAFDEQAIMETDILFRSTADTVGNAAERISSFSEMGMLSWTEVPPGGSTWYGYDALGRLSSITDVNSSTTLYGYDALGERTTVCLDRNDNGQIDQAGSDRITSTATTIATRQAGALSIPVRRVTTTTLTGPLATEIGTLSIVDTALNGDTWTTTASGTSSTVTTRTVDAAGFTITETTTTTGTTGAVTSSMEKHGISQTSTASDATITSRAYDVWGRTWKITDGRNNITEYLYFPNGDLATTRAPAAAATGTVDTQRTYDYLGRLATVTSPGATGPTVYTYDPHGRLIMQSGALTYATGYGYDWQGRMTTLTTYQDATTPATRAATAAVTTWTYTPSGDVASKTYPLADSDGDGTLDTAPAVIAYTYSGRRLIQRTWGRGLRTLYLYDPVSGDLRFIDYRGTTIRNITRPR